MGDTGNNTITHTGGGATGLTISSTNGHVTVEGVKFSGSNISHYWRIGHRRKWRKWFRH